MPSTNQIKNAGIQSPQFWDRSSSSLIKFSETKCKKRFAMFTKTRSLNWRIKMWRTFSKSALDEASKALNFSYNKQRASMTFSGSRANLKPNSAYQKVNHWGCNKRKSQWELMHGSGEKSGKTCSWRQARETSNELNHDWFAFATDWPTKIPSSFQLVRKSWLSQELYKPIRTHQTVAFGSNQNRFNMTPKRKREYNENAK